MGIEEAVLHQIDRLINTGVPMHEVETLHSVDCAFYLFIRSQQGHNRQKSMRKKDNKICFA